MFPPPVVGRAGKPLVFRTKTRTAKPPVATKPAKGQGSALSAKTKAERLVKKSPEVMVKISGNSKSMAKLTNHVDYISRNGKVEIEDQDGSTYTGKGAVSDILRDWGDSQSIPDTEEEGRLRETMNIVLSMPEGTDRDALKKAARDFALEAFDGREWFMAEHRDTSHPHVHLCIKMADDYGHRLNPRKNDIQIWREQFAEKLNEHGIEANATKRQVRGKTRRPKTQAQIHSLKNKRPLKTEKQRSQFVKDSFKSGVSIADAEPLKRAKNTRNEVLSNAAGFIKELEEGGNTTLANNLKTHFAKLPAVESEQQLLLRKMREEAVKHKKNTHEVTPTKKDK